MTDQNENTEQQMDSELPGEGEEITVIYESDRSVHRFVTKMAAVEWE